MASIINVKDFPLWDKIKKKNGLVSFELELTARCANNCRHCYVNLPAGDKNAREKELSLDDIREIADEAVGMGACWCVLTGGDPLIRSDFVDIYLYLKKKGLFVSILTSGVSITDEHARLFGKYPARDIEATVYGVTEKTFERVTRRPGSFAKFRRGLDRLAENGVAIRLKAMALRSNLHEMEKISQFCRERTKDYYRFDPMLHLRVDGNQERNQEIMAERLTSGEIIQLEESDPKRKMMMEKECDLLILPACDEPFCTHLFHCGAGIGKFHVTHDGFFTLCSSLRKPDCIYDLKKGNLRDAFFDFVPKVRSMCSEREAFLQNCRMCSYFNLCLWCPAHAWLEKGELDLPVEYFCETAHLRARNLGADPGHQKGGGKRLSSGI